MKVTLVASLIVATDAFTSSAKPQLKLDKVSDLDTVSDKRRPLMETNFPQFKELSGILEQRLGDFRHYLSATELETFIARHRLRNASSTGIVSAAENWDEKQCIPNTNKKPCTQPNWFGYIDECDGILGCNRYDGDGNWHGDEDGVCGGLLGCGEEGGFCNHKELDSCCSLQGLSCTKLPEHIAIQGAHDFYFGPSICMKYETKAAWAKALVVAVGVLVTATLCIFLGWGGILAVQLLVGTAAAETGAIVFGGLVGFLGSLGSGIYITNKVVTLQFDSFSQEQKVNMCSGATQREGLEKLFEMFKAVDGTTRDPDFCDCKYGSCSPRKDVMAELLKPYETSAKVDANVQKDIKMTFDVFCNGEIIVNTTVGELCTNIPVINSFCKGDDHYAKVDTPALI